MVILLRRFRLPLLLLLLFILVSAFVKGKASQAQGEYAADEIIVKYRGGVSSKDRYHLRRKIRGQVLSSIPALNAEVTRVEAGNVLDSLQRLKRDPRVEYAEPNYKATVFTLSNDPYLSKQWGLFNIQAAADGAESAWDLGKGDSQIEVAILDTGIASNHPDLSSQIAQVRNFTNSSTSDDRYGHGTHVAGIVAAVTNNGQGVAGLGYRVRLANVKVLDDSGSGYYSSIANGIIWAADQGIPVINMSLGGSSYSYLLADAVRYAWQRGALLVAAAGNSGKTSPTYPAFYNEVIAVAAIDSKDRKASFSSYGPWVEVAAPGVNIYSTVPTSPHKIGRSLSFGYASGTSMATPHVSGLAGLLVSTGVRENGRLRDLIGDTADRIDGTGIFWSKGRINAYRAMRAIGVKPAEEDQPTVTPTPTKTPIPTATPTVIPSPTPTSTPVPTSTPTPTLVLSPTPTSTPSLPWWCIRYPRWCRYFR